MPAMTQIMLSNYIRTPSFGAFTIPIKSVGDPNFFVTPPTSNSTGAWLYTSSNPSIVSINSTTGEATVLSAGTSTITVTQSAAVGFMSRSITGTSSVTAGSDPYVGSVVIAASYDVSTTAEIGGVYSSRT